MEIEDFGRYWRLIPDTNIDIMFIRDLYENRHYMHIVKVETLEHLSYEITKGV